MLGHGSCHGHVDIIPCNTSGRSEEVAVLSMTRVFPAEDLAHDLKVECGVVNDMADGPRRLSFVDFVHPFHGSGGFDDSNRLDRGDIAEALALSVHNTRCKYVALDTVPLGFFDDGTVRDDGLGDVSLRFA